MASQSFPYRLRLLTAALGLALLAAVEPASARPLERQEDQLRAALEDFTASLKTETEKLAERAAEAAQEAEQTLGKAAERMAEEVETFDAR